MNLSDFINKTHNIECSKGMKQLPDECVDLTITSPPYDNLRNYNGFHCDFIEIIKQLFRVTKQGGVVVWIVNDSVQNGGKTLTSFKQAMELVQAGFKMYDTMIWLKPSPSVPTNGRYYDVFEYMFIFSKGTPKTLNLLCDRKNKCSGELARRENCINREKRKIVGERVIKQYSRRFNVWQIPQMNNDNIDHPAVFPEQLANDHILSWSNYGEIVLDPFMGSGTVAKMAIKNNRNFIGFEISKQYCDIANSRIKNINQELMFDFNEKI